MKTIMHLTSTNSEETFLKDVVSGKRFFRVNTAYFYFLDELKQLILY